MEKENLLFRQLFEKESSTYTYLLADKNTKEAILIDPVRETNSRDINLIKELGLKLKYILETHVHADHVTSSHFIREEFKNAKVVAGVQTNLKCADILLSDDEELKFGEFTIKAISTPGHTNGCTTYNILDMLFTGDTILIRSCGRTDFQHGSSEKLYNSIQRLFKFPDNYFVYPAHDYKGLEVSTIGEEKLYNEFAKEKISKQEFIEKLDNLKLDMPKKIHFAVPSNEICGEKVIEN